MRALLVVSNRITALQYYRQDMPHAALSRTNPEITYGKLTSAEEGFPDIMQMSSEELSRFEIISFLRQITYDRQINSDTVDYLHSKGKKVILDIDDYWRLPAYHKFYDHYKKYKVPEVIEHTLSIVDYVTVTTSRLAEKVRKYNPNVTILPNCIGPDQNQFKKRKIENRRVRFGWVGGVHHLQDIEAMGDSLKKVHSLGGIQLCLGGFNLSSHEYFEMEKVFTNGHRLLLDDKPYLEYLSLGTPAMEHVSFDKPYRRLWGRDVNSYADIYNDIDVALAPLRDHPFNSCKSELKIIEAAWMGKAVIASDIPPYSDVIDHGVDGFLVSPKRNGIDWFVFMKRYAETPGLLEEHAEKLEKKIRDRFDIYKVNEERKNLYVSLA